MKRPTLAFAGVLIAALTSVPARAEPGVARVALVVGANAAAPGRQPLVYGHRDAEKVAEALVNVGGFRAQDVEVLRDPRADVLLAALGRAITKLAGHPQSLLYFYYSGHSDERALYPGGQPVALEKLRALMDGARVSLRIGVVDACRGGGWTRAKGLVPAEPFAVQLPLSLDNEGSVLISSSSGLESAHESDQLQGSFFTHHFVMGMRGGADRNGNGEVTLNEAFEYAKERTIRDSLRLARETQHPSYAVNLRGRRELVLANVNLGQGGGTIELAQQRGPLELVHIESGVSLLELLEGARRVRLAVPPGRYLVRKMLPESTLLKEVKVDQGETTRIEEGELALVGTPRLSIKAHEPAPPALPVVIAAAPAQPRAVPTWAKTGAYTSTALAAMTWGLFVKLRLDVRYHDRHLDPFRRYLCTFRSDVPCDKDNRVAPDLTEEQQEYVAKESRDRADFHRYSMIALGAASALTVSTGFFVYKWLWGKPAADEPGAISFAPLGPDRLGLSAAGRF